MEEKTFNCCDNRLSNTVETFAACSRCFTASEVAGTLGPGCDTEGVGRVLATDQRFVNMGKEEEFFVAADALFQWWAHLTMKLAKSGENEISRDELADAMNSLRKRGKRKDLPHAAIAFGERFGFVRAPAESQVCIFPIAGCLSHLSPSATEEAKQVLPNLFSVAQWGDVVGNESAGDSRVERMRAVIGHISDTGIRATIEDALDVLTLTHRYQFYPLTPREQRVLRLRFGLEDGRARSLEEVAKEFKVTRERIRQIEAKGLRKSRGYMGTRSMRGLRDDTGGRSLVDAFLTVLMARRGSLVLRAADARARRICLTARLLGIPFVELRGFELVVFGAPRSKLAHRTSLASWCEMPSEDAIAAAIEDQYGPYLSDSDLAILVEAAVTLKKWPHRSKALNPAERVHVAMQHIGRPAHYSAITEVHNSLFPEEPLSEGRMREFLRRQLCHRRDDIVWRRRGTYALGAWGYEGPSGAA